MKLFIASDIHGSAYWCQKMIEAYKNEKADRMLLLGDILYHGPRNDLPKDYNPKEVCKKLNLIKNKILCIKGNCDAEVDEMVCDFKFNKNIRLKINGKNFFFTHGHKYNIDNIPPKTDILIYGHFHTGFFKIKNNVLCVNPGSVSIPKENSQHGYITIEDDGIHFKNIDMIEYRFVSKDEF